MSGIFNGIYKRRGDNGGPLQTVGRKMLAHLDNLRKLGGAESQVMRRRMPDGSIIEARFLKDQPVLTIVQGEGDDACAIYMESGCLDLGQNLGSDAKTFYSHQNVPKPVYFGESTDCDVLGGLNGRLVAGRDRIASQCIERGSPDGVTAKCLSEVTVDGVGVVTSAHKIAAQSAIPASMFTGLTRRAVQAAYGCPTSAYIIKPEASPPPDPREDIALMCFNRDGSFCDLPVGGDTFKYTITLCDVGRCDYWWVRVPLTAGAEAAAVAATFTPCGDRLLRLLKNSKKLAKGSLAFGRLESYLFTQIVWPNEFTESLGTIGFEGAPISYGWRFNGDGTLGTVVTITPRNDRRIIRYAAKIEATDEGVSLSVTAEESYGPWPQPNEWTRYEFATRPSLKHPTPREPIVVDLDMEFFYNAEGQYTRAAQDFPISSWFAEDGALRVLRYKVERFEYDPEIESITGCMDPGGIVAAAGAGGSLYSCASATSANGAWPTYDDPTPPRRYAEATSLYIDGVFSSSSVSASSFAIISIEITGTSTEESMVASTGFSGPHCSSAGYEMYPIDTNDIPCFGGATMPENMVGFRCKAPGDVPCYVMGDFVLGTVSSLEATEETRGSSTVIFPYGDAGAVFCGKTNVRWWGEEYLVINNHPGYTNPLLYQFRLFVDGVHTETITHSPTRRVGNLDALADSGGISLYRVADISFELVGAGEVIPVCEVSPSYYYPPSAGVTIPSCATALPLQIAINGSEATNDVIWYHSGIGEKVEILYVYTNLAFMKGAVMFAASGVGGAKSLYAYDNFRMSAATQNVKAIGYPANIKYPSFIGWA